MGLNLSGVSASQFDGYRGSSTSSSPLRRISGSMMGKLAAAVKPRPAAVASPNPDPFNCEIVSAEASSGCAILLVRYPTCTTYEGHKLLLFAPGVTADQVAAQGAIDPHFTDNSDYIHPVARFVPDERGLAMARAAAAALAKVSE